MTDNKEFQVRLSACGTNVLSGNYKKMKNESALRLAFIVNYAMLKAFVGEESSCTLRYHLACVLLDSLAGWKAEKLLKDIKKANDFYELWKIKK